MRPSCGRGKNRVLAVTGSSGGHIFPALSLLDSLKDGAPEIETLLVLPQGSIRDRIGDLECPLRYVSFSPIKLSLGLGNIMSILKFFKGVAEELWALLKFRPAVVVGFGGMASVPLILLARAGGRNTLIHEQNVIPGRANRLLALFSNRIALSFGATADYLKCYEKKIIITGNPLRREMAPVDKVKARDYFALSQDKFTLLVSGGSQGSHSLNSGFLKIVPSLARKHRIQVIHLSGNKDYGAVREQYRQSAVEARVYAFSNAMQYAYSAADLIISRAGATTIAELMLFKIPALLVPYPYAYSHQAANAWVLSERGCAFIIDDAAFARGEGSSILGGILNNSSELERMRRNYQGLNACGAAARLREAILELI